MKINLEVNIILFYLCNVKKDENYNSLTLRLKARTKTPAI